MCLYNHCMHWQLAVLHVHACAHMYMHVHHLSMHRVGAPSELMSLMGRHCSSYSPGSTPSSTSPSKGMISCMHS